MSTVIHIAEFPSVAMHRWQPRHAWFIAAALLLHAVILVIPYEPGSGRGRPDPGLPVEMLQPSLETPIIPAAPAPEAAGPAQPVPETAPVPEVPVVAEPAPVTPPVEPAPMTPPVEAATPLTTLRLIESIREGAWKIPPSVPRRRLGVPHIPALPRNWVEPLLPLEPNRFDDAVLPSKVEIVDRWRDPDGSHRVVISTPTGDTLCGRAEAYSPMNPLIEPIMMFHACGGGGERKFRFSNPQPLRLN